MNVKHFNGHGAIGHFHLNIIKLDHYRSPFPNLISTRARRNTEQISSLSFDVWCAVRC